MINLDNYGVESVGVKDAIINALKTGLEFERIECYDYHMPKSLKVSGRHIGLLYPPEAEPPIKSNDDFIAAFESFVEYKGLYYEIHYSVI